MTTAGPGVRALIGARVSRVKEIKAKTSHLVQHEQGVQWAQANGFEAAGFFEDLNVSAGKTTPFQRPELKPWLTEKIHEWDAIVITKSDRLFRSGWDCAQLMQWSKQHEKMMVIIDDGIKLDYRKHSNVSPADLQFQELMLTIGAKFGEMELERIRARAKDTRAYLNTTTRWAGGAAPWGYKIVDHPEGGKTLEIDEPWAKSVKDAVRWILAGVTCNEVASRLTKEGVPTPHVKAYNPDTSMRKEAPQTKWDGSSISRYLRSPAVMGIKKTGAGQNKIGTAMRDEDGMPIQIATPLISDDEWNALQQILGKGSSPRSQGTAPLLDIAVCAGCGRNLYLTKNKNRPTDTYRCAKTKKYPDRCGTGYTFPVTTVEQLVKETMLDDLSKVPYPDYKWHKGSDATEELERVKRYINDLEDEWDEGLLDDRDRYKARKRKLVERKRELEKQPFEPSGWVAVETDKTYAEKYKEMTTDEERRQFLIHCGIKIYCGPDKFTYSIVVPHDLAERALAYGVHLSANPPVSRLRPVPSLHAEEKEVV